MNWIDLVGYGASASVLVTFCMSNMVPLRSVAICSNVLFATFGAAAHVYPVLALHLILLPVNCARLREAIIQRREAQRSPTSRVLGRQETRG
jgi:CRP/FNR family transcriptional regulator, cyclic AMP receptor protein